jgi:hypothetical protein
VLPQLRSDIANMDPGLPIFSTAAAATQIEGALFLASARSCSRRSACWRSC